MRLLRLNDDGSFSLHTVSGSTIPYAILSHTWGDEEEEVTFEDISNGTGGEKAGYQKLRFCGKQAKADKLDYFWVDTCCIDKRSLSELTEAINSMFRFYRDATRCYVYLWDVLAQDSQSSHVERESCFRNSRWFTRGWTLQELIAPKTVEFYSRDHILLGDKDSLEQQIHEITGIAIEALRGHPLQDFSIQERFKWVEKRQTTKEEDLVYCLLGIFNIYLPLIYGEGRTHAMGRLERRIEESEPQSFGKTWRISISSLQTAFP
jgi:Heterokaryon incompatibility protein (HET)